MKKYTKVQLMEKYQEIKGRVDKKKKKMEQLREKVDHIDDQVDKLDEKMDDVAKRYGELHALFPVGTRFRNKQGIGFEVTSVDTSYDKGRFIITNYLGYTDSDCNNYRRDCDSLTEGQLKKKVDSYEFRQLTKDDWYVPSIVGIKEIQLLNKGEKHKDYDNRTYYDNPSYILTLEGDIYAKVKVHGTVDLLKYELHRLRVERDNDELDSFNITYKGYRRRSFSTIAYRHPSFLLFFKTKEEAIESLL